MRPKPYTFRDKLSKYKNTITRLLAYQKIAKSICQFEDLPMQNIFLVKKDEPVNKIGSHPGSQGFLSYTGEVRQ